MLNLIQDMTDQKAVDKLATSVPELTTQMCSLNS